VDSFSVLDGLCLLVVDDHIDTLELITVILEQYGTQIMTATSVGEALEVMTRFKPDILISDIAMPEEDGYSLIRKARALSTEPGEFLPAIALTAYAGDEDRIKAVKAGFQMHVTKPVEPAELVAVVAKLATSRNS
jgi:CheY-like chemotaxis protein